MCVSNDTNDKYSLYVGRMHRLKEKALVLSMLLMPNI